MTFRKICKLIDARDYIKEGFKGHIIYRSIFGYDMRKFFFETAYIHFTSRESFSSFQEPARLTGKNHQSLHPLKPFRPGILFFISPPVLVIRQWVVFSMD